MKKIDAETKLEILKKVQKLTYQNYETVKLGEDNQQADNLLKDLDNLQE
ncbi:MAG: hypothetical protein WC806_06465 [Candidatus Gracilibacteria bacterium]|jgi:hypothetical protein